MLIRSDFALLSLRNQSGKVSAQTADKAAQNPLTALGKQLHERRQKQLQEMQAGIAKLKQLKQSTTPKMMARDRAAMLKQRLDMLKSIISKLSPGDHKAMARELKQIARELAALGKQLGKDAGGSAMPLMAFGMDRVEGNALAETAMTLDDAGVVPEAGDEAAVEAMPDEMEAVQADAEQLVSEADQAVAQAVAGGQLSLPVAGQSGDADDKALREMLVKARALLKEVAAMLKAKHRVQDKESRKLFAEIEKGLKDLDKALGQSELTLSNSQIEGVVAESGAESGEVEGTVAGNFIDARV